MDKKKPPYHHGDLRASLIQVATEIITELGMESLTLRLLSERIGVSRTAPYRHFTDKSALLAAVAEEGFRRLLHKVKEAMRPVKNDTIRQFMNMGNAYVQFAQENPTYYRLMVSCGTDSLETDPDLEQAGDNVFDLLVETIKKGQKEKKFIPANPLDMAYVAWAAVHGLASLIIDDQIPDEADIAYLADITARTLVNGMVPR